MPELDFDGPEHPSFSVGFVCLDLNGLGIGHICLC